LMISHRILLRYGWNFMKYGQNLMRSH